MIALSRATVVKSGVKLFQQLDWNVAAGEHWVVTGANGSGKTTLLEMIAGSVHLSAGALRLDFINGDTWDERYADRKKKILYIPAHALQTLHHDPNAYYQQRYYRLGDEQESLVRDVLGEGIARLEGLQIPKSLSIDHLLDRNVIRLSNGQLKKVLFVQQLLKGVPRFLLLDYPFEGLDKASRRDLCNFIDFMAHSHAVQVILVDHRHELPQVINRRLTLDKFTIHHQEACSAGAGNVRNTLSRTTPSRAAGSPVIEIKDLSLRHNDAVIFDRFNWTVRKGERWALVGRNGAGKTTLFSMIFADHPYSYSQNISVFGKRRGRGESIWDIKKRIHYVGSERLSYLNSGSILMTMRQFLQVTNRNLDESLLGDLMNYFEAQPFIDLPVRHLSSGQLQLMMIMNCLLTERELMLFDEPFQFLDEVQRKRVSDYLQSHMPEDATLILITHDDLDLKDWAENLKSIE